MRISYNWLKKYVDTELSPVEVGKLLTDAGLEVEHIEPFESLKGGLKGLVVGEVKTCIKHPNADKLLLTTVDVGGEKILNIVCGAPNVAAGQKVIVAIEGATLHPFQSPVRGLGQTEGEPFTIKKSKIRGEASEGMICAEDEIGLSVSHQGIMVLPPDTKIGLPASEYFQIYTDSIFEIGVTPNRADALSHFGVARDLAAAINIHSNSNTATLRLPGVLSSVGWKARQSSNNEIIIKIENPEACKRYTGAEIRGIEIKESPSWLKNYLSAIGLRPINNIVDITNFVMMETGQPLHAFDADKIKGNGVVVRKAKPGETLITLDGIERKLKPEDLLICDESNAMCIAGVYGGKDSGVTESTKNIFLESACFDAVHIRKTARNYGLHTDASYRFERGTDVSMTEYALIRAIGLMEEENPTLVVSKIQDVYPVKVEEKKIEFSVSYANKLAGHSIPDEKIMQILRAVGIKIENRNQDTWLLSIPTYRLDITGPADIVEEILRFYGYNNIPIPEKLNIPMVHAGQKKPDEILYKITDFLSSLGFSEVMNTSLSSSKYEENNNATVKIANPLSVDLDIMRGSLLYNGLTNIALNQNNKQPNLKLYEFGRSYHKNQEGKYKETEHLSLWLCGNKTPDSWNSKEQPADFYNLKTYINVVIEKMTGIASPPESLLDNDSMFSYGICFNKKGFSKDKHGTLKIQGEVYPIASLGKVRQEILKKWDIKGDVYFADFNWKILLQQMPKAVEVKEINRFPAVTRDLALIINKDVQFAALLDIAGKTEKELLKDISVFDVYEGKGVEEGKKSYALRFVLQSDSKTLSEKEIEKVMEKLTKAFSEKAGAVIRNS